MFRLLSGPPAARLVAALTLLVGLALLAAPVGAAAAPEWVPGRRMIESVGTALDGAKEITDLGDYGYDSNICILAGFLADGQDLSFNRPFEKGGEYLIIGGADKNAVDVDIDVYDPNGTRLTGDGESGADPVVKFRVPRTGAYKIRVSLKKTKERKFGAFCTLAFLRKDGYDVPVDSLVVSVGTVILAGEKLNEETDMFFQSGDRQWALYGAVLDPGEDLTITKVRFGRGKRVLVAGGDKNAEDVDAMILDEEDEVLYRDKGKNPFAVVPFPGSDRYQGIRFRNTKSKKGQKTLIVTGVLVPKE